MTLLNTLISLHGNEVTKLKHVECQTELEMCQWDMDAPSIAKFV